jgi:nicotinamide-nucleotide amidase
MTGGLGPTNDDITKKAIAEYYGSHFVFSEVTYDRLIAMFKKLGRTPSSGHREQCLMPSNATLLMNDMGSAPGMYFDEDSRVLLSLPGVPYEMKHLVTEKVIPLLKRKYALPFVLHHTILTVGEGEARLAERINDIEKTLPEGLSIAYLPGTAQVRVRISGKGVDKRRIENDIYSVAGRIEDRLSAFIFGHGESTLEKEIGILLRNREETLCTAESCTGGHLAHLITSVPGASDYFVGSIVAYSNAIKENTLGVRSETLQQFGAVSEETVREMALGALSLFASDHAISISGIAGPGGGTKEKPAGTVWIAYASKNHMRTLQLKLSKDRLRNISYSSVVALNILRKFITPHEF